MGQIISTAAKPKRCNLNHLSQVPTPAAGEYILVSSDNSMNAAGQGNFDCYIVGDGTTAATALELHKYKAEELEEKLYGKEKVLMDNVTTQASIVYITADMVTAGDVLVFQLESINNLQGALRAEKEGYVFDQYITVAAGQSATVEYTVPENFLKIYTQSGANPVLVTCTVVRAGDIGKINDDLSEIQSSIEDLPSTYIGKSALVQDTGSGQNSVMSQKTVTQYGDSPFAVVVPEAMKGLVAFRMMTLQGDSQPLENYTLFRVVSFIHDSTWGLYLQVQCSTNGETWTPYDSIERRAANAPSPLPVIEEITSKYGRFVVVVNWPMIETLSVSSQNYVLKKYAPNYFYNSLGKRIDELSATVVSATDSPFITSIPSTAKGLVAFRMENVSGDNLPVDNYTRFRVTSIIHNSTWGLYLRVECSTDGETWEFYDSIERRAADSPSPLPIIEEITSKYKRFKVIVNWPIMGTVSVSNQNYLLKTASPNYFSRKNQEQIDNIKLWPTWNDYELKDRTKQIVKVDINGNGDYTSIADAYAAITDSSYENQYEVVVYAGTYHEYNLIPPKFTHTHGLIPDTVIVTSEGATGTAPVFDQKYISKLSFMKIISGTGYCVHQDYSSLAGVMLANENLYCKKVYGNTDVSNFKFRQLTNPSVLGIGSHFYGAKFIWNNCIFENGEVGSHTVGGSETIPANQHLIYKNCKLVNAYIWLGVAGTSEKVGNFVCEIDGLYTEIGCPSVICKAGTRTEGEETYNFPWQIIGGGNRNFVALTDNNLDTSVDDVWPNINTDNVTLVQLKESVSKNQFVNITGMVCDGGTDVRDIVGMALESGSAGDSIRVCTGCFAINNSFVGNNFPITTDDGNYGIGNDGRLLKNASNIIGRVKYNIFYINSQSN